MKKIFYSLLGLTLLFSCSKDDSPSNPTANESCTVTSINSLHNEVLKIEYGGDGKIAKYSSGSNRNYSYTYSKTQIKVLEKYQSEVYDWDTKTTKVVSVETPYEYTLDDRNRIVKRTKIDLNRFITIKYKYSAEGLLSAITSDDGKIYTQINYNNGNISGLDHPIFSESYNVESDASKSYVPFSNLIIDFSQIMLMNKITFYMNRDCSVNYLKIELIKLMVILKVVPSFKHLHIKKTPEKM